MFCEELCSFNKARQVCAVQKKRMLKCWMSICRGLHDHLVAASCMYAAGGLQQLEHLLLADPLSLLPLVASIFDKDPNQQAASSCFRCSKQAHGSSAGFIACWIEISFSCKELIWALLLSPMHWTCDFVSYCWHGPVGERDRMTFSALVAEERHHLRLQCFKGLDSKPFTKGLGLIEQRPQFARGCL